VSIIWNTDDDVTPAQAAAEHASQDAVRWAVRDALLAAGSAGLTNRTLCARFGASAVKRLNDLKHHGYTYRRTYVGLHTWRYVLELAPPPVAPAPPVTVTDRQVSAAARILRAHRDQVRRVALRHEPTPVGLF
jgi:hypothetical protein